jgi:anaerobic selenocysteine-containing dehydrogenase
MTLGQADETAADGVYTTPCWECSVYCGALATDKKRHGSQTALPIRPAHIRPVHSESNPRGAGPDLLYQFYSHRRVGARGEGRCVRISWDQALDEIADRFAEESRTHGPEAIAGATSGAAFDP